MALQNNMGGTDVKSDEFVVLYWDMWDVKMSCRRCSNKNVTAI